VQAQAFGSSFYWAMRLLPERKREAVFAIYAFCREVDDIADGDAPDKNRRLAQWRARIDALYGGPRVPPLPLMVPLGRAVRRFDLRRRDFRALIDGMGMDAVGPIVAPTWESLDLYCDRVASAVGRLCVRVFGVPPGACDALAHELGRALQLTNILRDLREDAARGRLYLPREALEQAGIGVAAPQDVLDHPNLPAACAEVAGRARAHFTAAARIMARCPRDSVRPCRVMAGLYEAVLDRVEAVGWPPSEGRVRISSWRKVLLVVRHSLLS